MRLSADQVVHLGEDAALVRSIDGPFLTSHPFKRIGVAVSGGGDSMALLHAAQAWCGLMDIPIEAVTVDHGLRAEAKDEAALVGRVCEKLDVPHTVLSWDGSRAKKNLAAAGREARYRLIAGWAIERDIDSLLLGHTMDDIAETYLMRLARKSGVNGLSMMDTNFNRNGVNWARPFWQRTRAELRIYLRRNKVPWAEDPTNIDERYERAKARKAVAALEPLGITTEKLLSAALVQSSSRNALRKYASEMAKECAQNEAGDVVLSLSSQVAWETEWRLMTGALRYVGNRTFPPRSISLDRISQQLREQGKCSLAGCILTQEEGSIRFTREFREVRDLEVPFGSNWDRRWFIHGPSGPNLTLRALGENLKEVPDWRATNIPRDTLLVSPAVFDGPILIAAPMAGLSNGYKAHLSPSFSSFVRFD